MAFSLPAGEPGFNYDTEAFISSSSTVAVGEEVELICRFREAAQYASSVASAGSQLQWTDGGVVVEGGSRREVVPTDEGVILRIHNFSLSDHGLYMCRCVNMFNYTQFRVCGGLTGLPSHCAATVNVSLLPAGIYTTNCLYATLMYPMTTMPTQAGMVLSW